MKCQIKELFNEGERGLVIANDFNSIELNESNFINLLIKFGTLKDLREYFIEYKLQDIEHFLIKNNIKYVLN